MVTYLFTLGINQQLKQPALHLRPRLLAVTQQAGDHCQPLVHVSLIKACIHCVVHAAGEHRYTGSLHHCRVWWQRGDARVDRLGEEARLARLIMSGSG